ncbi:hypothetical protein [Jannaschia aquimarina]|uniref:hypothetical protein n=1 Tax=Jannaschia aquimarina TaxID=935700 RepID=UPI0005C6ACB4|nr:hypothetical protein [Jannaschia aquimarina]
MADHIDGCPTDEEAGGLEARASEALMQMERLRVRLSRALDEVDRTGVIEDPLGLAKGQKDLEAAYKSAFESEGRALDVRRKRDGGGGLDLDAARAEVESRLDRLRGCFGQE